MLRLNLLKRTAALLLLPVGIWTISPGTLIAQDAGSYSSPEMTPKPVLTMEQPKNRTTDPAPAMAPQSLGEFSPLSSPAGIAESKFSAKASTSTNGQTTLSVTVQGSTAVMTYNGRQLKGTYDAAKGEANFNAALNASQTNYLNSQKYVLKVTAGGVESFKEITSYKQGMIYENSYYFNTADGQFFRQSSASSGNGQNSKSSTDYTYLRVGGTQQVASITSTSSWSSTQNGVQYESSSIYSSDNKYEVINGAAYVSETRSSGKSSYTDGQGNLKDSSYENINQTFRNEKGVVTGSLYASRHSGEQGSSSSAGYSLTEGNIRESANISGIQGDSLELLSVEKIRAQAPVIYQQHYADSSLSWNQYLYSTESVAGAVRKVTYPDGSMKIVKDASRPFTEPANQIDFKNYQQVDIDGVLHYVSYGIAYSYPENGQYYGGVNYAGVRSDKGPSIAGYGLVFTPVSGIMTADGYFAQSSTFVDYPGVTQVTINGKIRNISIEGGIVQLSPEAPSENPGIKVLAEIKALISELGALEGKLTEALAAKQGLEDRFKELDAILNGKTEGMLWMSPAGMPEEMAFFKQVIMTLELIAADLQKGLDAGDQGLVDGTVKRFISYRDMGDPAEAKKQLMQMIEAAGERLLQLPALIEGAEMKIAERAAEQEAAIQKFFAEFGDLITVHSDVRTSSSFAEKIWPQFASYGDVLLPWKHLIYVTSKIFKITLGGMEMELGFQNGIPSPDIAGTAAAIRAAMKEYPGQEISLIRHPEVLSLFGGYSVVRNGFAHFLSVSKNGETSDFVLFETVHPANADAQPVKTAKFSAYDATPAMVSAADVNQDGVLNRLDADLMIQATVTESSWGYNSGVKIPDLNGDGIANRADALIVVALVHSGNDFSERLRLMEYIRAVLKAQEDFFRALPGIWGEVEGIQSVISRENLAALLENVPADQAAYLLNLHDYFTLMKTGSEAIAALNPDLIAERHPEFFDNDGNLVKRLVDVIADAGLAELPVVAVFADVDTRIPLADLKLLYEEMHSNLGDDPAAAFEISLGESRVAAASVMESLHAVNETIQAFLESLRNDREERSKLLNYIREVLAGQEAMLQEVMDNWSVIGSLKAGMTAEELRALVESGMVSQADYQRFSNLMAYQNMIAEAGRVISSNGDILEVYKHYPQIFDLQSFEIRPEFAAFMERENLPGLLAIQVFNSIASDAPIEAIRELYNVIYEVVGSDISGYFAGLDKIITEYAGAVMDTHSRIEREWNALRSNSGAYGRIKNFIGVLNSGSLDFDGNGQVDSNDHALVKQIYSLALETGAGIPKDLLMQLDVDKNDLVNFSDAEILLGRISAAIENRRIIEQFVKVLKAGSLDFNGDGLLDEHDTLLVQKIYGLNSNGGTQIPAEFLSYLDLNKDGLANYADAQILITRIRETQEKIGRASALAKALTGLPDLNADGKIDLKDLETAVSGYQAAMDAAAYLPAEISSVLDVNKDGRVGAPDADQVIAVIKKAIEDSRIPEFKGFEVSAATGEYGKRDLSVKVAADGSALVTYQGQVIKSVFDRASGMISFLIPKGPYEGYLSSKKGEIQFLGADAGYAMQSFVLRQYYNGGNSNNTHHVFRADGMLASLTWEHVSPGYSSKSTREFVEYQKFSNGEFRAVEVASSSKSSYAGGAYSSESREKYSFVEIGGNIYQTASVSRSLTRQDSGDGKVQESIREYKYFTDYSSSGQAMNQVSVSRSTFGDESVVSAWYQLSDPKAMTRTYANTQSARAELYDEVNGVEAVRLIDAEAHVKSVQFFSNSDLNWPMKHNIEYSRETRADGTSGWRARRADIYDATGRSVSRIIVDPSNPLSEKNPLIQSWQNVTTKDGVQYSVSFGPAYSYSGQENGMYADGTGGKTEYLGYGLVFSAWIDGRQETILVEDFPNVKQVTFPDGSSYVIELNEKGVISLI